VIIDSHVHLFPPRVFDAIWRWFDRHAWNIRYRLYADDVLAHFRAHGVARVVGLCYSHVPEMARDLNRFMAELARAHPEQLIALGTVLPGEPNAEAIIDEALRLGLRGFKIHCHVQKLGPDDARLDPLYARAAAAGVPVVIHAGTQPCLAAYGVDIHAICSAAATRRALERHPSLTMIIPHLGDDEEDAYFAMLDEFPNLHLDTTMMVGEYFDRRIGPALLERHSERVLYGTDFPNIPYEWDRELRWLERHVSTSAREKICGLNAAKLFGVASTV
jgi:predicted TIM-barrel fold metal-dependent hydrolase